MDYGELPEVEFESYKLLGLRGRGSFGKVYEAKNKTTGERVAIKLLSSRIESELQIMETVGNHPNVMGLRAVIRDQYNRKHAVMDLMQGALSTRVYRNGFREAEARRIAEQVLKGIQHIHSHGVLHRDLKPENILVDRNLNVKITDFGLARKGPGFTKVTGTVLYMAPEVLYGRPKQVYNTAVDMWSFGCILAELFLGRRMFGPDSSNAQQQTNNLKDFFACPEGSDMSERIKAKLAQAVPTASVYAIDLMSKLLSPRWDKRPSATEALQHPFFSPLEQQKMEKHEAEKQYLEQKQILDREHLEQQQRLKQQQQRLEQHRKQLKQQKMQPLEEKLELLKHAEEYVWLSDVLEPSWQACF